jgi:hypothetical protein
MSLPSPTARALVRGPVLGIAAMAASIIAPLGASAQADAPVSVTCRVRDDPDARVFVLQEAGPSAAGGPRRWQLSMRDRESKDAWIHLALPGASPAITAAAAKLSYRNANGGRQVELEVGPAASRLDVWVDYGLDVNIEPDLDPRVDRLNTHGPITALTCTIGARTPD